MADEPTNDEPAPPGSAAEDVAPPAPVFVQVDEERSVHVELHPRPKVL